MLLWYWVISEKIQMQILSSEEERNLEEGGNLEENLFPVFSSINLNCGNIYKRYEKSYSK